MLISSAEVLLGGRRCLTVAGLPHYMVSLFTFLSHTYAFKGVFTEAGSHTAFQEAFSVSCPSPESLRYTSLLPHSVFNLPF